MQDPTPLETQPRWRRGLAGIAAVGGIAQLWIQRQAYSDNPMVLVPQVDATVIWNHAGKIAGVDAQARFVGELPFETAPLTVWMAAAVRALGGGLAAFGALQSVLYVATALVLVLLTRDLARRFAADGGGGAPDVAGLLAGALFLLLDEPAAGTSRVLAGTLQLFLGAALLLSLVRLTGAATLPRALVAGLLSGLCALAYPPFLALVPLLAVWHWFQSGRRTQLAAALALGGALAIAPATIHNALSVGEFIPISTQAGLTFYHGNNPEAEGVIAPIGVVNSKEEQALDSLVQARVALGEDAGWNDASRYWLGKGLDWWADSPGRAFGLSAKKLWYGLSGRNYGDIYQPWRERSDGVASRLWLAPIPLAWVLPLGLMALFGLVRRRGLVPTFPLLLMIALPLAVVVVFWYTPRYRLPATVGLVPLVGIAVARMASGGRQALPLAAALALGVLSGVFNRAIGFDADPEGIYVRRHLERMAAASGQLERHDDGARFLGDVLALDPSDAEVRGRLVQLYLMLGRDADAVATIREAPPAVAALPGPRVVLAWTLATSAQDEALDGTQALEVSEALIADFGPGPELLDVRAAARARLGDFAGAEQDVRAALEMLTPAAPLRTELNERLALYQRGLAYRQPRSETQE